MRLTVGPLPAAVYWRRRAVVLAGLALIVLIISYACGGSDAPMAGASNNATADPTSTDRTAADPMSTKPSSPKPATSSPKPTATPGAFTLPPAGTDLPCADTEMAVVASAGADRVTQGQAVDVTISIKNVSNRTCKRDIGADMQELRLVSGKTTIWSSDDCGANRGSNVSSFPPGRQVSYTLTWQGKRSRTGTGAVNCGLGAPDPGSYHLVARLDQKLSEPFSLHIQA